MQIFESLGKGQKYACDPEALAKVRAWLDSQPRVRGFGNGRLARNLFESIVARQSSRLVSIESPTDDQLCTFTADDVPNLDEQ